MDVVIVGGGAAGLATAIFTKRHAPNLRVVCLDGARRVGAKILVSGGSRCNVTNRVVAERDFWGGEGRVVRSVLRAFPAPQAAGFFADLGVALHEEADGKLFPDTNRARTVLDALLDEIRRVGVELHSSERVTDIDRVSNGFAVSSSVRRYRARAVVLATGGLAAQDRKRRQRIRARCAPGPRLCRHDASPRAAGPVRKPSRGAIGRVA